MIIQQLLEQPEDPSTDVALLVNAIKRADRFLNEVSAPYKIPLRGIQTPPPLLRIYQTRVDRRPKDSIPALHTKLDNLLAEEFGIKYRSTSVFTTSNQQVAFEYGYPTFALPLDDFKFCWSPVSDDALSHFSLRGFLRFVESDGNDAAKAKFKSEGISVRHFAPEATNHVVQSFIAAGDTDVAPLFDRWVETRYREARYQETDYSAAHKAGHEVMWHCSEVAIIRADPLKAPHAAELDRMFNTTLFSSPLTTMRGAIEEINNKVNLGK